MESKKTSGSVSDWLRNNPIEKETRSERLERALSEIRSRFAKKETDKKD